MSTIISCIRGKQKQYECSKFSCLLGLNNSDCVTGSGELTLAAHEPSFLRSWGPQCTCHFSLWGGTCLCVCER